MERNEIIALAIIVGIFALGVIYENIMHRLMSRRLKEAKASADSWKSLYLAVAEERDLLHYRVQSKDCQKVICYQMRLDDAENEIKRLKAENETYKKQLERNKKRKENATNDNK